jgi:hypothetical protein
LNRIRGYAAISLLIILAVFSLGSSFSALQYALSRWKFSGDLLDDPIIMANRLKLLEASLPPRGSIGYLSEQDIPGLGFNPIDQDEEFAMTQYALAPRIIVRGADQPLVIVNIPNQTSQSIQNMTAPFGLTLVEKFDFGLYLYRH